jgi:SAM-dependent methyltransferase
VSDSLFSAASAYEQFMGRWSRALAPLLVRFAGVHDGDVVLDIGSGTGVLSAAVASAAPAARVTGVDPADAYVAFARATHGGERVAFEVGDARQLRFADGTYDCTLSLLAINFIPDSEKAVAELKRVTRRGGTVAVAVWDYGAGMEMLRVFWDAAIALTPADDLKDERHMPLTRRGELAALWHSQKLSDVVEQALTIETPFNSFDDFWEPFTLQQGPAGAYVARLTAEQRRGLQRRLQQRLQPDGIDRPFTLTARAWAVRGTV